MYTTQIDQNEATEQQPSVPMRYDGTGYNTFKAMLLKYFSFKDTKRWVICD